MTPWDEEEKAPSGDIVKVQFLLNDQKISTPDEIWLSNRDRGSRYFSWIDILTVKDRKTGEEQVSIVQRLTDDSQPMETRKWKIITIAQNGEVDEEVLSYAQKKHQSFRCQANRVLRYLPYGYGVLFRCY